MPATSSAHPAPKQIAVTGWSSKPFGATPLCPWMKSKKPTPAKLTVVFAV